MEANMDREKSAIGLLFLTRPGKNTRLKVTRPGITSVK